MKAYGYGIGRKILDKMTPMEKLFFIGVALAIALQNLLVLFLITLALFVDKVLEKRNENNDNRGESPLEIMVTIMVFIIMMIGLTFTEGTVIDGFIYQISKLPFTLSPPFQQMMLDSPIMFAEIFFAIPTFFGAVLLVWGVKSIIRKHGYTQQGQEYYTEEF